MNRIGKNQLLFHYPQEDYILTAENKFEVVSCPVNKVHCVKILPELNELYATSELARINKEYLRSAESLHKAYNRTCSLKESSCAGCVNLFQNSIIETMETMQDEVHQISFGFFPKRRYGQVYVKLSNLLKKMSLFHRGLTNIFPANTSLGVEV